MSALLKQRRFFLTKEFELTNRGVKIKVSSPISLVEEEVNFDDILLKIVRKKLPNLILLGFGICILIALVLTIISHLFEKKGSGIDDIMVYAVLFLIFSFLIVFTYENEIKVSLFNGKCLSFYPNSPSKKDVVDFLEKMKSAQKQYFLNKYAKADPYITPEQFSANLKWLWDRKVIDDDELQELKNILLPKSNGDSSVGFRFNPADN